MTATTFYFVSSPKTGNVYLSSNYGKVIPGFLFLMVALDPSKICISFLFTFSFSSSSCYFQFKSITTVGLLVFICVKYSYKTTNTNLIKNCFNITSIYFYFSCFDTISINARKSIFLLFQFEVQARSE
jgi:hypothetical protein